MSRTLLKIIAYIAGEFCMECNQKCGDGCKTYRVIKYIERVD